MVLDFVCKPEKVIVEVDESQHNEPIGLARDRARDEHFEAKGYRIVRLWNADINRDPDVAAETVFAVLNGEDPLG
jgi:very-short-patch-repair endonuclease